MKEKKTIRKKKVSEEIKEHFLEFNLKAKNALLEKWKNLDEKLSKERNKKELILKDIRKKTIWNVNFGLLTYKRRRYFEPSTRTYRFLLDEELGIPKKAFVLPEDQKLAIKNFHKYRSYQEIADNVFNGYVSKMSIHNFIKRQKIKPDLGEKKKKIASNGIVWINADGLHLKLNGTTKTIEVKNFCFFTGRVFDNYKKRKKLENRLLYSFGNINKEEILDNLKKIIKQYDNVKEIRIIGDGARWIKTLARELDAKFYLDKFHFKKTINDLFKKKFKDKKLKAIEFINNIDLKTFELKEKLFELVVNDETGEIKRTDISRIKYLVNNRSFYLSSIKDKAIGIIEAIHAHFIAKFFKRQRRGFCAEIIQKILFSLNNWFNFETFNQI